MIVILDDDQLYLNWLQQNPNGFVINAYRKPSAAYIMLHRAGCHTISDPADSNWTTTGYLKACSSVKSELSDWSQSWFYIDPQPCQKCRPTSAS